MPDKTTRRRGPSITGRTARGQGKGGSWRPTGSLSHRITRLVAVTAAVSMFIGSLLSVADDVYAVYEHTVAVAESRIEADFDATVAALNQGDAIAAGIIVSRVAQASGAHSVTLLDENGATLAAHRSPPRAPRATRPAAEQPVWLRTASGYVPDFVLPDFRHERQIMAYGTRMGVFELGFSSRPLIEEAVIHFQPFAILVVVAALVAVLLTGRMRRQLSRPISDLLSAMDYVARTQDYSRKLPPHGPDEVGSLIISFNEMLGQINMRNLRLAEHRRRLQELVAERTRNFEAAARDAERSSRAKGDFLARMSHEIRTPMNGVVGMAELLEQTALEQSQHRMLNTMRTSADALLEIINDILDFSKIEAGQLQVLNTEFGVHEMLEEVADLLAPRAHERGLELVCDVGPAVPVHAAGDPIRIRQIVTNLLGNAIKYTEQGTVILRATVPTATRDGIVLRLEVQDTGLGIPEDQLDTIFEAFTQGQSFETRKHGGTGLGLAITKQLVTILNGEIHVESKVGAGSRFWADIPLGNAKRPQDQPAGWSLKDVTVLVAQENEAAAKVTAALLEEAGARAWVARTGQRALERIQLDSFGLIVADRNLPDMPAVELLDKLRALSSAGTTPMVVMTTATAAGEPVPAGTIAPDAVLIKPVRRLRLREAVDRALGRAPADGAAGGAGTPVRRNLGLKVLLVEDSPVNREVATGMLEALGCTVDTAGDGSVGVELALGREYDVVLMDCQMPLMDGFEATRRIRSSEQGSSRPVTPIVALTANALPGDRERCLLSGMNEFISKPFTLHKLQDILCAVTHTRGTAAEPIAASAPVASADAERVRSVLDTRQIDELRALGRPQLVSQAIAMFRTQAEEKLAELERALSAKDAQTAEHAAHALKSSSLSVGGRRFASVASLCEQAARGGDMSGAAREAKSLRPELASLLEALDSVSQTDCAA